MIRPKALFSDRQRPPGKRLGLHMPVGRAPERAQGIRSGIGVDACCPIFVSARLSPEVYLPLLFYEAPDERRDLIRSHIKSKVAAVDNVYLSIWHVATIGLRL
jgi:hypothetical protein